MKNGTHRHIITQRLCLKLEVSKSRCDKAPFKASQRGETSEGRGGVPHKLERGSADVCLGKTTAHLTEPIEPICHRHETVAHMTITYVNEPGRNMTV